MFYDTTMLFNNGDILENSIIIMTWYNLSMYNFKIYLKYSRENYM